MVFTCVRAYWLWNPAAGASIRSSSITFSPSKSSFSPRKNVVKVVESSDLPKRRKRLRKTNCDRAVPFSSPRISRIYRIMPPGDLTTTNFTNWLCRSDTSENKLRSSPTPPHSTCELCILHYAFYILRLLLLHTSCVSPAPYTVSSEYPSKSCSYPGNRD